jgi:hypothetical protein
MSLNILKRFTADVVFAGSNYLVVQPLGPELRQLHLDVRDLLAWIEAQQ